MSSLFNVFHMFLFVLHPKSVWLEATPQTAYKEHRGETWKPMGTTEEMSCVSEASIISYTH